MPACRARLIALSALLEHLDVRGATLVGFSMGGGEVVRYIATFGTDPDEFNKALLDFGAGLSTGPAAAA